MKHIEIIIAIVLIAAGLSCLSMAPLVMGSSVGEFVHSLVSVCIWTAIPLVLIGLFYLFYIRRK